MLMNHNQTRENISKYISKHQPTTVKKIVEHFTVQKAIIHRHLKKLIEEWKIYKEWSAPRVLYYATGGLELLVNKKKWHYYFTLRNNGKVLTITNKGIWTHIIEKKKLVTITEKVIEHIYEEYITVSKNIKPNGLYNILAYFIIEENDIYRQWYSRYIEKEFQQLEKKNKRWYGVYLTLIQSNDETPLINALAKLTSLTPEYKACNEKINLDSLHYTGLDKIDNTKSAMYQIMESIKEFQDKDEIKHFYTQVFNENFEALIKHYSIDTIIIIPNSVWRKISFNEYIEKKLKKTFGSIPFISVTTNTFPGRRPQKKIHGICKRIENATKLFDISDISNTKAKNILLVDDVLWSWATMNTVAKKIKAILPNAQLHGYSILGSYRKWFDVVSGI